jgi:cystathionine beta-synthase
MSSLAPGTTMVALVNDGGEKYMDTVFDDDWMHARDLIDPAVEREIDELLTKLREN